MCGRSFLFVSKYFYDYKEMNHGEDASNMTKVAWQDYSAASAVRRSRHFSPVGIVVVCHKVDDRKQAFFCVGHAEGIVS